jgi:hypothetical protein
MSAGKAEETVWPAWDATDRATYMLPPVMSPLQYAKTTA